MRVVFLGSGEIAIPSLRRLVESGPHSLVAVVAQPDKPAGRRRELRPPPTKEFARAHGIPVLQPARIRAPEALDSIRDCAPEILVVMAYGQILPNALIELPPVACINLHASLLPRHRGASPIHAAIAAGDPVTGVTVMHVAEALDAGDILLKKVIPIRRRETTGSLHDRLAEVAADAMGEALDQLASGIAGRIPQDETEVTYSPKLDHQSGRIDWNRTAPEVDRLIRAMNPWPAAWTRLPVGKGAKETRILSGIVCRRSQGPAGAILRADPRGLLVACGEGAILIRRLQPEGSRPMEVADFLRGHAIGSDQVAG